MNQKGAFCSPAIKEQATKIMKKKNCTSKILRRILKNIHYLLSRTSVCWKGFLSFKMFSHGEATFKRNAKAGFCSRPQRTTWHEIDRPMICPERLCDGSFCDRRRPGKHWTDELPVLPANLCRLGHAANSGIGRLTAKFSTVFLSYSCRDIIALHRATWDAGTRACRGVKSRPLP